MRAIVTGGTGFIGRHLIRRIEQPVVLTRDAVGASRVIGSAERYHWEPEQAPTPAECFKGIDAVFHLAGEPVAAGRWTDERKRRIRDSRVIGTRNLVTALERLATRPGVLVSASAVGFYGDRDDEMLDETSPAGGDFLAQTCLEWEAEAMKAAAFGMRVAMVRTGIVLGEQGGALARMLTPFRLGVGGRLGTGRQWMPWVHRDDVAGIMLHAAKDSRISGPVNAVAPGIVNNADFTRVLARVLGRPAVFPVPEFGLRLAFGEMAEVLLASARVRPAVAERTGYQFAYTELEPALRAILDKRPPSAA